jgi:DNA repair exonuclease SbcCD ATPase subunit
MENTVKESVKTIPSKAKVRVIWEDDPNNYTQERQKRISKYIVEKYGNPNVQVIFKPKKIDTEAGEVEMTVADNVMDKTYQRKLFKEWVETNKVGVDWERLLRLDDKVNEKLSQERDIDYRYRNWFIKDIEWSNFLSYGDGNTLSFKELEGITVVTSNPPNMGGKTILSLDLLLFLFFNTTTKGTTAAKMFNKFRDCNEVKVKGTVVIDGVDYIIERIVTRKLKRDGINYTTRTDLSFYRVLPDGTVENLEGEQRRETEDFIKKSIGSVNDFLLTIITDGDNLETILHTKPTEKGRILSRFIGLEVIEDKETIVKEMKSKWAKGLKSDIYNITELETNIKSNEEQIQTNQESINKHNEEIETLKLDIEVATKKKEDLIESKIKIDTEVINLRPEDLDNEIKKITDTGKKKKAEYDTIKEEFDLMEEPTYDEDSHNDYMKQQNDKFLEIGKVGLEKDSIEKLIKNLEEGEYCTTCGQALKDVDHSVEIEENKVKLKTLTSNVETLKAEHEVLNETVSKYNIEKKGSSSYDRKSLMVDKLDLDLGRFRLDLREKKELKKRYDDNLDNIEANKEIDTKILGYASKITSLEADKTNKIRAVENLKGDISNCETQINKDKETIEVIKSEEEIKMIFEVYARMVGKNGIIKMIMKSVMPLINSEIDRLISDTVEFKLTVDINDKKEVEFLINKVGTDGMVSYPATEGSGFEKTVSSLALRMVMTKISCLPKPNIIVFDEVFNKVANENLELVGTLFEKAKEMFPNIFLISHNDVVKDWANNIITVNKENDVSSLNML